MHRQHTCGCHACERGHTDYKRVAPLDELKRNLGPEAFNAQYLQAPVPAGENLIKPEWLKWFECAPTRQCSDQVVLSVDTAAEATATSNYSAMLVFLVRNTNEFYLIEIYRERLEFPDPLSAIEALITKYKRHRRQRLPTGRSTRFIPVFKSDSQRCFGACTGQPALTKFYSSLNDD
jgi:hypothetical protein